MSSSPPELLTPADLNAKTQAGDAIPVPVLPTSWRATVLLSPFGMEDAPLPNYSQHVIADVTYYSPLQMRVSLYFTQDLRYYDFLFRSDGTWYWLVSTPGGPVIQSYGPFSTSLQVPAPDFISAKGGKYGAGWTIMGTECLSWVIPTQNGGTPDHGSWYSFNLSTGNLFRIFTFDSNNPCLIPILGSYYLANFPTFTSGTVSAEEQEEISNAIANPSEDTPAEYSQTLVTQKDILTAVANPLASALCTLTEIQALIPGFLPTPGGTLPEWTDQTFIEGYTIGTDFIPYYTLVYYWYTGGKQQSIFIGLGPSPGRSTYDMRQDCCLFASYTDLPQYYWQDNWVASCCYPRLQGVGLPYPDWLTRDGGTIQASITGNAAFGLVPGEVLNLISAPLVRGPGELALFWVWFKGDGQGVLFTEANYKNSVDHNLQLIDYTRFEQNATWINDGFFTDPCGTVPACPSGDGAKSSGVGGPHSRTDI